MHKQYIPYRETGFFSPLVLDYLDQDPKLRSFYGFPPEKSSFSEIIEAQKTRKLNREGLVTSILKGYSTLQQNQGNQTTVLHDPVMKNIEALKQPNTFTITTGHQLNLFSGPLYTLYKVISTIKMADEIERANPGNRVIPLFWMATEDHDFAEINHLSVNGKTLTWDLESKGATGKISTLSIKRVVSQFLSSLGMGPHYRLIEEWIRNSYLHSSTLSQATLALFNALFGKWGLVILDADDSELKQEFSDIIREDFRASHSYYRVTESNTELEKLGYTIQVHPRPVNFFYLAHGIRSRFIREPGGGYSVLGSDLFFTEEDLETAITTHPEFFSPNVAMRPLYQEKILPNLAYIGGGGEIAYWLSLKSTFDQYSIPFPALFLRNSALLVEKKWSQKISRLGFSITDFFKDSRELIKEFVIRSTSKTLSLDAQKSGMINLFDQVRLLSQNIDPSLGQSTEAIQAKTLKLLQILEKKMIRREKDHFDVQVSQIIKIKQSLFPNHGLQERTENIFPYISLYGPEVVDILVQGLDPFDNHFAIMAL